MRIISHMVRVLPCWLFKKYADLWVSYGNKEFSYSDMNSKFTDTSKGTAVTKLVRYGWINRIARARYTVNSPEDMTKEVAKL